MGPSAARRADLPAFLSIATVACALLLAFLGETCGGGNGGGTPPPPPPTKYTVSGKIYKIIANDNSVVAQGTAKLEGSGGSFSGAITSSGSYSISSVPAGTYKFTVSDGTGNSFYVTHVDSTMSINGNLTSDHWVIERGDNRFGVPFDSTIQAWYGEFAQGTQDINFKGIVKWDLPNAPPSRIDFSDNPALQPCIGQLKAVYDNIKSDALKIMTDGRMTDFPTEYGQPADRAIFVTLDPAITDAGALSDFPVLDGNRIVRARTRWNPNICEAFGDVDVAGVAYHELGRNFGARALTPGKFNISSNISNDDGVYSPRPTANDRLAYEIMNSVHTPADNRFPDTNKQPEK